MQNPRNQKVSQVQLERVDLSDRTFAVSPPGYDLNSGPLVRSIEAKGVLVPVRLFPKVGNRFGIISGFRRVAVAAECRCEQIPALIEEEPENHLETYTSLLWENTATREFSMLERAFVLSKLKDELQVPEVCLVDEFLPILGLRANRHNLVTHLAMDRLSGILKHAVAAGELIPEVALKLDRWSKTEQELFVRVSMEYHLGRNKQRQFWDLLDDLRSSERVEVTRLWSELGIGAIEQSPEIRHEQRFGLIRQRFWDRRYPVRSEYQKRFEAHRRALALPPGVQLQVPENFEGDKISLMLTADSASRMRDSIRSLAEVVEHEALDQIFALI